MASQKNRILNVQAKCVLGMVFALGCMKCGWAQETIPAEVKFAAAGIRNSRQTMPPGQCIAEYYEFTPKVAWDTMREAIRKMKIGAPETMTSSIPTADTGRTRTISWYYSGQKMAMFVPGDPTKPLRVYERLMLDEKNGRFLQATRDPARKELGTYYSGVIDEPAVFLNEGLWKGYEEFDPRGQAYFWGAKAVDRLLLESPSCKYQGEELIDGVKCMKVEVSGKAGASIEFWIDTEHSFIVRRLRDYVLLDGKRLLRSERSVTQIVTIKEVSLPAVTETKLYLQPVAGTPSATTPLVIRRFSIVNSQIGSPLPPEAFVMDWPLGTNVTDQIERRRFAVIVQDSRGAKAALGGAANSVPPPTP